MAEPAHPEGWQVPQRAPVLAALGLLGLIVILLLLAGRIYRHTIGGERRQPVHAFPAPGVETAVHDGANDPPRARAVPPRDPAIELAKRRVIEEGLPGWPE